MFKRIAIFLGLNILIVATVSLVLNFFNVAPYINKYGIDYQSLAIFCFIWGMVGALISLLLSKKLAKWMLKVKLIDSNTSDPQSQMILQMVINLSEKARLPGIPEVGIFENSSPNAFATGPSKRNSLVAVSRGLINQLSKEELEAVIGHEIAHIANGDMVTMTLLQGVVNAFVMFLARALAFAVSGFGRDRNRQGGGGSFLSYMLFTFLFEMVFMIAGSMVISYFSRQREFRADKGSSDLLGKEPMINALRKLERIHVPDKMIADQKSVAALMIHRPPKKGSFIALLSTHPSIEERINRLNTY